MIRHPFVPVFLGLLAAMPRAQDVSAFALLPERCHMVAQCEGWQSLLDGLKGTRVAKLLVDPELMAMVGRFGKVFEEEVDEIPEELRGFGEKLLGEGRFRLTFGLQFTEMGGGPPPLRLALVITPEAKDSKLFPLLTEELPKLIEKEQELREVEVDGVRFRTMTSEDGVQLALPARVKDHLVVLLARGGKDALKEMSVGRGKGFEPHRERLPAGLISFWMDLEGLLALGRTAIETGASTKEHSAAILAALGHSGVLGLKSLTWSLRAQDVHVVDGLEITLDGRQRGVFDVVLPDNTSPRLVELIPREADEAAVTPFRLDTAWQVVSRILGELEPLGVPNRDSLEKAAASFLKVRLKEDLLDLLGGDLLMVRHYDAAAMAAEAEEEEDDQMAAALNELRGCFAVSVRDAETFRTNLEKVVRGRGLHAGRKSDDYQGWKVHKLDLLGKLPLHYCVSQRLFLVGLGESGAKDLRAVLDEEAARKAGKKAEGWRPSLQERLKAAPEGWQSLSAVRSSAVLDGLAAQLDTLATELDGPESLTEALQGFKALSGLFKRHSLEDRVQLLYRTADGLRTVSVW